MIILPTKLNNLHIINIFGTKIACVVEKGFYFRMSNIMEKYLTKCETLSSEEMTCYLKEEYSNIMIQKFYNQLTEYEDLLFLNKKIEQKQKHRQVEVLTLSVTRACNMKCKYCFEDDSFRLGVQTMSENIAIKSIEVFLKQLTGKPGMIIFTGGEPLLAFKVIKAAVDEAEKKSSNIKFLIKTNGVLINKGIEQFILEHDINLQISLDGNKKVNDLNRVYPDGESTYNDVIAVVSHLARKNYKNIRFHATVTKQSIKYLIPSIREIKALFPNVSIDIKPVMGGDNKLSVSDQVYLLEVLDKVNARGESMTTKTVNTENICGIGRWHMAIDTNGDIYPCYRLIGLDHYYMGNILENELKIINFPDLNKLYDRRESERCSKCYASIICNNGCFADKLLYKNLDCDNFSQNVYSSFLEKNALDTNQIARMPII